MKRRALLGSLPAVAAAGCLRLTSGDEGATGTDTGATATQADTATTTATETEPPETTTASTGEPDLPDGLAEDGPEDYLYAFHVKELQQASFRVSWTKINTNRSFVKWQKEFAVESSTSLGSFTRGDSGNPVDIYRSGTDAYWRENMGDHYTYGNDEEGFDIGAVTWDQEIEPLLTAGEWGAPTFVEDGDDPMWELETDTVADESAIPGYHRGTIQSIDATMRVDQNAVIRSVDAATTIQDRDGEEIQYVSEFSIDALGEASVSEPEWLPDAKAGVPKVSASLTDDNRFVRLVIEGGVAFEPNSTVMLFAEGQEEATHRGLDQPIDPGVETYLYKADDWDQTSHMNVARGSKPTGVTPAEFSPPLRFAARRETNTYVFDVTVD
ncbi:hypothetical protein [Haloarchaeobius sp. TZWSO28]|uniref:hypothetical protein n=1 Tax=Haloarchaeobius sp. TZWSO28 TaxID=3446119 RepID=UPI003EB9BDCF